MPIFPKPIDLAANYDWTGDHTFDGVVTCNGDFNAVDGSFTGNLVNEVGGSYRLYQLGTDGDTDSRYLEVSDYGIQQVKTGAAGNQSWYIGSNTTGAGIDFTGNGSNMTLESNFGQNLKIAAGYNSVGVQTYPRLTNTYPLGRDANRWSDVYSVGGSFTGSLTSEVGGSYKLYNLGDESAADSEYLNISSTANVYKIAPLRTGSGAVRQFKIEGCYGPGFGNINFDVFGFLNLGYGGNSSISIRSNGAELLKDIYPNVTAVDTLSLGKSTARFGEFYSVDGSFSGTLKTEGFKTGVAATTQAAITLSDTDHTLLADCTSNNVVVSLPASAGNDGLQYTIKKVDGSANYCSVTPNGAETIDGQSGLTITGQYESVNLVCYSGEWYLV